jgi:hypothetical protein
LDNDDPNTIALLSNELKTLEDNGFKDITLLGFSKGGNLVQLYLYKLGEGQNLTRPKRAILLSPGNNLLSEAVKASMPSTGSDVLPANLGINVANVCAAWTDTYCRRTVQGARNFNQDMLGHGSHGHKAGQVFEALNVEGDHNAFRKEYNGDW